MKIWIFLLVCGLALATAAKYDDDDDDDIDDLINIGPDSDAGKGLGDRLRARLERALERIKVRLDKNKDLAAEFGERVKEITKHVATIGKEVNKKTLEKIRIMNRKIRDLARDILRRGGIHKRSAADRLLEVMKEIKKIILTPDGYHEFKNHILNLKSDHPILEMLKNYIAATSDEELLDYLKALFSGIPDSYKVRYASRLEQLWLEVAEIMKTDEGFDAVYNYFITLKSDHPVVARLQSVLQVLDKELVKDVLGELIASLEF